MTILITGATGFLGQYLLQEATKRRIATFAHKRSPLTLEQPDSLLPLSWIASPTLSQIPDSILSKCSVIVHLAAYSVNNHTSAFGKCIDCNLIQPWEFFKRAYRLGVSNFIVTGSCFEYGRSGDRFDAIPVDAPLMPSTTYGVSKALASIAFLNWSRTVNVNLEIYRLFHLYGLGEAPSRFWPSLKRAALLGEDFPMTLGQQIRDFTPVRYAARFLIDRAIQINHESTHQSVYNVGTGKPLPLRSIANYYWDLWSASGKIIYGAMPYRPNEVMSYAPGEPMIRLQSDFKEL